MYNDVLFNVQKHDDIPEPMGPEEFKEVAMVMGKNARKLHRMGILTGTVQYSTSAVGKPAYNIIGKGCISISLVLRPSHVKAWVRGYISIC